MKSRFLLVCALSVILLTILACGSAPAATPTWTDIPTLEPSPTPTAPPLYISVNLVSTTPLNETSTKPRYTVEADVPAFQGIDDQRLTTFNNGLLGQTQAEIAHFKDNARMAVLTPNGAGSSYKQTYQLLTPIGGLFSIKLTIMTYIEGAAHPSSYSKSINYDLENGKFLSLQDLFLPNTDYLETISKYCIKDLSSRPIDFVDNTSGAQPTPENYGVWNITREGLLITFDPYQVAAGVLGPQLVTVPWSELKPLINPDGPAAMYVK